jgi:hypothetical protein
MQGVVDPETLYMKQNCIGMSGRYLSQLSGAKQQVIDCFYSG